MKKKKKGWIWLIVVAVIIIAAVFLLPMILSGGANPNASGQQYNAEKATRGDIRVTVHGTGSIEVMDTSAITAGTTGKVDTVSVENGDAVKQGQVIAMLNDDDINAKITSLKEQIITQDATIANLRTMPGIKTLYAPVDCRVKDIYAKADEDTNISMSEHNALMVLSTDGKMKVSFVPASGVEIKAGDPVTFVIGNKAIKGFITTIPDSTTDKAEAVINNDSLAENRTAIIKNAKGVEVGRGNLEINRPLLVTAYSGTVDHIYPQVNETIKKGHKLFRLTGYILDSSFESQLVKRQQLQDDLDDAYGDLADLSITAPADGIVTDLALKENSTVQQGMAICTIQQNTGFKLVVAVDELDISKIQIGQKADIKIDALADAAATGEVTKISQIGVKANDVTTYDVTLKVTAPAGTLANMSASTDIEVAFKAGTLLVPVEAIHTVNGKSYVYGALPYDSRSTDQTNDNTAANGNNPINNRMQIMFGRRANNAKQAAMERPTIEVTVGLISDSMAEILSGLAEGDEIAVPVAQSSTNAMFGFGGGQNQRANSSSDKPSASNGSPSGK